MDYIKTSENCFPSTLFSLLFIFALFLFLFSTFQLTFSFFSNSKIKFFRMDCLKLNCNINMHIGIKRLSPFNEF